MTALNLVLAIEPAIEPSERALQAGSSVEVERCRACHLVWFDPLDLDALDKSGWVQLLQALAHDPPGGLRAEPSTDGPCPRCHRTLQAQPQQSQHGRYMSLACPEGHGHAQRDGALLASRGLFRPLLLAERVALATERRQLNCLQCGAAMDWRAKHCSYCLSPATVLDLPRLSAAIGLTDEAAESRRKPRPPGGDDARVQVWACHGCGHPLDPTRQTHCDSCRHPVLAPAMSDLLPLLQAAAQRLARVAEAARESALTFLPAVERRRIAELTRRSAHHHVAAQLERTFWRRYGVLASLCALVLLLIWSLLP